MRLQAKVLHDHRRTAYNVGRHVQDTQPPTVYLEITEGPPGFSLLHLDADGCYVADTWHPTLAEAMKQAKCEFGIEETGWISLNE